MDTTRHWVGTWATAPAPRTPGWASTITPCGCIRAVSIGGDTVRIRVSNAYGHGACHRRRLCRDPGQGPGDRAGLGAPAHLWRLRYDDGGGGRLVISDSVQLDVPPLADLAVTLYLPGDIPPGFQITGRYARQTNYISPPGNFAAAITMPVGKITDEWFFVSGIDVLAAPETGGVVALGDSLTDANISTHDAYCRWPDQLARRLIARQGGRPLG